MQVGTSGYPAAMRELANLELQQKSNIHHHREPDHVGDQWKYRTGKGDGLAHEPNLSSRFSCGHSSDRPVAHFESMQRSFL